MKTGLFFGSFNPIHIGHLAVANYMKEFTDLDEVWFIISPQNPFKKKEELLDDQIRLYLVRLALQAYGNPHHYQISDLELKMPAPSYTINTLRALNEQYPEHRFTLIMGTDTLQTFDQWKNHEDITALCERYIYPRPGTDVIEASNYRKTQYIDAPRIDISSSFIRNAIKKGYEPNYFLPPAVYDYIKDHKLYR